MGNVHDALDSVSEKAKDQAMSDMWNAQRELDDIDTEIAKLQREIEELNNIETSYDKASSLLHDSLNNRIVKLGLLKGAAEKSNSARSYSEKVEALLYGENLTQKVSEFDRVKSVIGRELEDREEQIQTLKQRRSSLNYIVYKAKSTLNELEGE